MKKRLITTNLIVYFILSISSGLYSQAFDFGDAPDPAYPTLLVNNGPMHQFSPFFLGSFWDAENNGTLGMLSYGDDMNGTTDDEDGIRFISFLLPGQNCTIEVIASLPGMLNGWIDFDFNSQWTDPYDWIFQDQMLSQGSNILSFPVPGNIAPGMLTFARFRFSTMPGLGFTGPAPDGEVEDYNVLLGAPVSQEIFIDPDPSLSYAQNEISFVRISGTNYNGRLIAAYNDSPFIGGPGMGVSISSDNGSTWIASHLPYPMNSLSGVPMAESFDPSIAADDSGNVFVAQIATDGNWYSSPSSGLYVYKSGNGGTTWTAPARVNDDTAPSDTSDQVLPWMEVQNDGTIHIVWYDRRNDPMDLKWDIYYTNSNDGGQTFDINHKINLASFYTPLVWFGLFGYWDSWMGEYLGLAVADYTVYVAYTSRVQDQFGDVLFGSYLFSSAGNKEINNFGVCSQFFSLYPNPSNGELNVELKSGKILNVIHAEIWSVYGQSVLKTDIANQNKFSLPVSDLSPGVYWVKIRRGEMNGIQKFIKIN